MVKPEIMLCEMVLNKRAVIFQQLLTVGLLGTPGLVSENVAVSGFARRSSTLLTGRG